MNNPGTQRIFVTFCEFFNKKKPFRLPPPPKGKELGVIDAF